MCPEDGSEMGDIIVFPGEFMEVLTRGYLCATLHRVVRPVASPRMSIPFLIRAKPHALISTKAHIHHALHSSTGGKRVPGPRNVLECEDRTMQWLWNYANGW